MRKITLDCGYIAYEVSSFETFLLGGAGICDHCNKHAVIGYLVPILNSWLCPQCFEEWKARAIYYPEDIWVEESNCRYYESLIPMDGGVCDG